MSTPLHLKSKVVFAGINSTVPRLTVIDVEVLSTTPDPEITMAILGPFNA